MVMFNISQNFNWNISKLALFVKQFWTYNLAKSFSILYTPYNEGATLIINGAEMSAKIYKPTKTAMQSGRNGKISRGCEWVLTYPRRSAATPDRLMGWQSSSDTARQVRMYFPDLESAIAYAASHNIDYVVQQPKSRRVKPKAYADNFAFSRNGAWTH